MLLNKEIENKIENLVKQMTVEEKIGQLSQISPNPVGGFEIKAEEAKALLKAGRISESEYESIISNTALDGNEDAIRDGMVGSFIGVMGREKTQHLQKIAVEESRLGIPIIYAMDVIHGYRTIFPIPLGLSCTWNDDLIEKSARIAAEEATEEGVHWTLAPMVDVSRDARWGRIAESAGEDPYLASNYAASMVKGFQGEDISKSNSLCSCPKHFVAYGACEGGRDYNTTDMSIPMLYETYLPPFKAAINSGAATIMAAFNDLNGVPCTLNDYLLKDILRDEWNFKGFVISDATAIKECVAHGSASDTADAAAKSLKAGLDMDLCSGLYVKHLKELLENGKITMDDIDFAVKNVLRVKFAKGLFENPYAPKIEKSCILCDEFRKTAREISAKSMVLLKNESLLPIEKSQKTAIVGHLFESRADLLGTCGLICGKADDTVTFTDSLKNNGVSFEYAACTDNDFKVNFAELEKAISTCDTVIAAVGEIAEQSGEAASYSDITLVGEQVKMLKFIKSKGKKLVTVLFNGRPLAIPEVIELSDSVIEAWHPGTEAGNALFDIIFGNVNPSGRLTATFPHKTGSCPIYYNHPNTGRPDDGTKFCSRYADCPTTPLFPFGFGLSYTEFKYSNLTANVNGDEITVSVDVENIGDVTGEETVQFYFHRTSAKRVRPVKELKAYKKVVLKKNEKQTVSATVTRDELGYYDTHMNFITQKDTFKIWACHDSSSEDFIKVEF